MRRCPSRWPAATSVRVLAVRKLEVREPIYLRCAVDRGRCEEALRARARFQDVRAHRVPRKIRHDCHCTQGDMAHPEPKSSLTRCLNNVPADSTFGAQFVELMLARENSRNTGDHLRLVSVKFVVVRVFVDDEMLASPDSENVRSFRDRMSEILTSLLVVLFRLHRSIPKLPQA